MSEMNQAARAGWCQGAAGRNPHLYSSPVWLAFEAGRAVKAAGLSSPSRVRMSRGYSIRIKPCADDGRLVTFGGEPLAVTHVHVDHRA